MNSRKGQWLVMGTACEGPECKCTPKPVPRGAELRGGSQGPPFALTQLLHLGVPRTVLPTVLLALRFHKFSLLL